MSFASNRVSGSGTWGMTTGHMVIMTRDPDLFEQTWEPVTVYVTSDEVKVFLTSTEIVVRMSA